MTEDEAKTKWCPMARLKSQTKDVSFNRAPDDIEKTKCIASNCMMWVTEYIHGEKPGGGFYQVPSGNGYCGLVRIS